jgi:hypothetical protein
MIIFIGGVAQAVECLLIKHEALNSSTSMIKKKALLRKIEKTIMKFINNHKRPEWPKSFEQKEPSRMGCRRLMPIIIARSIRIVASGQPGLIDCNTPSQNDQSKIDWRFGSNSIQPTLQV